MHVYNTNAFLVLCMSELADTDIRVAQAKATQQAFEPAEVECAALGVTPARHSCIGVPSSAIAAHAKSMDADLIVMGTRGRTPAAEMMIGSVSDRVVRTATCPVTLVR
jgi:nucleotide-binding universal stress UspA family protein